MGWVSRTALPGARGHVGGRLGYAKGKYHFIGGITSGSASDDYHGRSNRNDQFDPVTNTWTNKANYVNFISLHCVDGDGDVVYMFGGLVRATGSANYPSGYLKDVRVYNPDTNSWISCVRTGGDLPLTARRCSMTSVGSDLYVFYNEGFAPWKLTADWNNATYSTEILSPTGFDYEYWWSSDGQMLSASDNDGNIYVCQAGTGTQFVRFDPSGNTMVEVASLPEFASGGYQGPATLTRIGDQLCMMGGSDYYAPAEQWQQQWMYDPSMDTWTRDQDCPVGFSAHASCEVVERASMLVAGGLTGPSDVTYRTDVYETEELPVDAPVMSLVANSVMSVYPMLGEAMVTGSSFIAAADSDTVYGGTIAPGIRATGIPI